MSMDNRDMLNGEPCEKCECGTIHHTVSEINFRLKGRGWAKDGYSHNVGDIEKHTGKDFVATPLE